MIQKVVNFHKGKRINQLEISQLLNELSRGQIFNVLKRFNNLEISQTLKESK